MANVTKELVLNETFMSTEQTPRNVADILADELENIANAIEGGGSGGHVIQDASGTDLAQEAKLQFGGMLKATDDSENGVTKVSDLAEEVEWSVWNAMTEAQRTAYSAGKKLDIINVPSVSGSIPVELIKTLWTNPDPTAEFAQQNITLLSNDYDMLLCVYLYYTGDSLILSKITPKGNGAILDCAFATSAGARSFSRLVSVVNDTTLGIGNAQYATASTGAQAGNNFIVPFAIYGIKSSVNVDVSALVANVSTSADKCMLSDGETSVEDALNSFEFGNQSTSGNDRTITLAHDYSAMTACFIQPISDLYSSNYTVKLPITFTAPRTVSFKIATPDGSVAGAAITCGFMFVGTRA